ncbi:MAG: hypothetical protein IIZ70_04585 [Kiritimatiellae bacterium]|nr:hypothetical protein [Kiritimatiellia bacterium]
MTEAAIVEAVRAAGTGLDPQIVADTVKNVPDADAVARFEAALAPSQPAEVPFASQVSETWRAAQDNRQGILHRIKALTELRGVNGPSMAQMTELQYEVMNLSFQQEVVTNVAKKSSDAVSTLVKNG